MKPPRFWDNPPHAWGLAERALWPVSAMYAAATARRLKQSPAYLPRARVLCVGNLNAGGTGKTPTVIALAQLCAGMGVEAAVISRGYGGSATAPVQVDPTTHSAADVGDEPLLLAAFLPVFVCPDRAEAARLAEASGDWDLLIMDDGFQNPTIRKDLSLVVVDAQTGFGNGRVIPAGPLREPPRAGLARADAVLTIGAPTAQEEFNAIWGHLPLPLHLTAQIKRLETGMDWQGMKVLAFAGIGKPEKFFRTLKKAGADVIRTVALDDHQPLTEALMTRILSDAARAGAQIVTTEKDAVRLPPALQGKVLALPVRLVFDDAEAASALLNQALGRASS